jgi:hypothetical protein
MHVAWAQTITTEGSRPACRMQADRYDYRNSNSEGHLENLEQDKGKDNALGKAFYFLGRPSVRALCHVECKSQNVIKITMLFMHC